MFITGTDTEIGKTWCTLALIQYFKEKNLHVAGMKPIASGCHYSIDGLRNDDAEQILDLTGLNIPYNMVNPYPFEPPIAPHIAAKQTGQLIDLNKIIINYKKLQAQADIVVVEGFGGWRVPINADLTIKDMVLVMKTPVILVVGIRLGCINHALLTAEAIIQDGCYLVGWIANFIDKNFIDQQSIDTISDYLSVPLLAQMPYLEVLDIPLLASKINNCPAFKFPFSQE
ncbi:dethiobiotin synthase [Candidatus Halobeggiatoa sp. HSG11]|nr:dethiobiotin synthase [Candidatus Halobeggiatoa sp. HSG11]